MERVAVALASGQYANQASAELAANRTARFHRRLRPQSRLDCCRIDDHFRFVEQPGKQHG